jgi:hypothetical protein
MGEFDMGDKCAEGVEGVEGEDGHFDALLPSGLFFKSSTSGRWRAPASPFGRASFLYNAFTVGQGELPMGYEGASDNGDTGHIDVFLPTGLLIENEASPWMQDPSKVQWEASFPCSAVPESRSPSHRPLPGTPRPPLPGNHTGGRSLQQDDPCGHESIGAPICLFGARAPQQQQPQQQGPRPLNGLSLLAPAPGVPAASPRFPAPPRPVGVFFGGNAAAGPSAVHAWPAHAVPVPRPGLAPFAQQPELPGLFGLSASQLNAPGPVHQQQPQQQLNWGVYGSTIGSSIFALRPFDLPKMPALGPPVPCHDKVRVLIDWACGSSGVGTDMVQIAHVMAALHHAHSARCAL